MIDRTWTADDEPLWKTVHRRVIIALVVGATWVLCGIVLAAGACVTALAHSGYMPETWPPIWMGALGLVVVELEAHVGLRLSGVPNFYDGRSRSLTPSVRGTAG